MNWPRYMVEKSLRSGAVAFTGRRARPISSRASRFAASLWATTMPRPSRAPTNSTSTWTSWRSGRGEIKELDLRLGSEHWLGWSSATSAVARGRKVSKRSRYEYERALKLVVHHQLSDGAELGSMPVHLIDAKGVDDLYVRLQHGKRVERRLRQANLCMVRMGRAWDAVRRYYPKVVPADNPFKGVELEHGKGTSRAASRAEAYALHEALIAAGDLHLAAVPLICFEWHRRPENVLAGHLTWADYRPTDRPNAVRVVHHKTKRHAWMPLTDKVGPLFPELTEYLDGLERLGLPVVLMRSKRGNPAKPFLFRTARSRIRPAAEKANLGSDLTLAACRHGGLTELGDAELTEQTIMSLSDHATPQAARLYVQKTEQQRTAGARKRRAWVEAQAEEEADESRNKVAARESENGATVSIGRGSRISNLRPPAPKSTRPCNFLYISMRAHSPWSCLVHDLFTGIRPRGRKPRTLATNADVL